MSAGCTHPLRQANGASVVLMAALTQLTEEAATQKPKAEATQLRPLPFLLYLADGDTARRAPRPLRAAPAPRRARAAPPFARAAPAPRPHRARAAHAAAVAVRAAEHGFDPDPSDLNAASDTESDDSD